MIISQGVVGRAIPRRTDVTREASIEPSVAVTGDVCGSSPAAVSDGPAIIPICRGDGASIHSVRAPALSGAIEILPLSDRSAPSLTRSSNVTGSPPGFSTGMTSLPMRLQSHVSSAGLNSTAGCPSAANMTCIPVPSRASMIASDASTTAPSPWLAETSSARQQTEITALPQIAAGNLVFRRIHNMHMVRLAVSAVFCSELSAVEIPSRKNPQLSACGKATIMEAFCQNDKYAFPHYPVASAGWVPRSAG